MSRELRRKGWARLMVGLAPPDARALFLLAQDGAPAAAHEAVDDAEQSWRGVLK